MPLSETQRQSLGTHRANVAQPRGLAVTFAALDPSDTPPRNSLESMKISLRGLSPRERLVVDMIQKRLGSPVEHMSANKAVRYLLSEIADAWGINADASGYVSCERSDDTPCVLRGASRSVPS